MMEANDTIRRKRRKLKRRIWALASSPLMRGSLVERRRKCGKENCKCARDPEGLHTGLFLTAQIDGRTRAMHIRPDDEERVRDALAAYDSLWRIINQLTAIEFDQLKFEVKQRKMTRKKAAKG